MKGKLGIEFLLIIFMIFSLITLFYSKPNATIYFMAAMSLLAILYLGLAFYEVVLGILQRTNNFGLISVFAYFALSFIITGLFSAVFLYPVAKVVLVIGLLSSIGCLAIISMQRIKFLDIEPLLSVNGMLMRLFLFTLLSFLVLRTSLPNLYKTIGPLKDDAHAIELLEDCMIKKSNCGDFYDYQRKTINRKWK